LWNVVHAHYFFFVGLAGWLADPRRQRKLKGVATPVNNPRPIAPPPWHTPRPHAA
jgi:hypothetical protein